RPELGPPEPQSKKKKSKRQVKGQEEMLRLVGALERIDPSAKAEWGEWILKQVESGRSTLTHTWALARLGARVPFSGAVHNVVDPDVVENWLIRIQALPWKKIEGIAFAAAHLARRTDDRNRDINGDARHRLVSRLVQANEPMLAQMVRDVIRLEKKTETRFIGDTLPAGLRLRD
ncbi:MAG: molecular chaperone DnaK, partial [Myxococcota bacterium]|nr:molecular chaperone DnaK [Myxococcota bacterium]